LDPQVQPVGAGVRETGSVRLLLSPRRRLGLACYLAGVTVVSMIGPAGVVTAATTTNKAGAARLASIPAPTKPSASGSRKAPTTRRVGSKKQTTTTRSVKRTTRPATTSVGPTSTVAAALPSTSSSVLVSPPTIAVAPVVPTIPGASSRSAVAFERGSYTFTVQAGTNVEIPFFLTIAPGFTDPLQLRVNNLPPSVLVRFDPNPARNFFTMTLRAEMASLPSASFDIEAVSTLNPSQPVARTTVTLFVNGTTAIGGPIGQPNGDPLAPPGIAYSVSPTSVEVQRGTGAGTVRIDITRQGNYSGPVSFAMTSSSPAGVGTSFQANSTAGNVNYLFISAGSSAAPGTYALTFDVTTTTQRMSVTVTVVVK
jgi:hypothetical protein